MPRRNCLLIAVTVMVQAFGLLNPAWTAPPASNVLLHETFEGAAAPWHPEGPGTTTLATGYQSSQALGVEQPVGLGPGTTIVSHFFAVEQVRNTTVRFTAMVKAQNVATPPHPYNGVKFMLVIETPSGTQYPARSGLDGTFDWQRISFEAAIPADATSVRLVLGVEATTGKAWFDDIDGVVVGRAFAAPEAPASRSVYDSHPGIARLRGVNVPSTITADDLQTLGHDWHANLIRFQLYWHEPNPDWTSGAYEKWIDQSLDHLDTLMPVCRKTGIHVLIDLHSPPGGADSGNNWQLFRSRAYEHEFLTLWDRLSKRYAGNTTVWGYDLANEPVEADVTPGLMDWHALVTMTAQIVRKNDPAHAIIVEMSPWDSCDTLKYFAPLPVAGIVYSIHFYDPQELTQQGVSGSPTGIAYPGIIGGARWDAATMASKLAQVVEYQKRYRVPIYVGEFSAIRWAPNDSAYRWLKDVIDTFEANGWDWTYHAYREWDGWSVEYGSDPKATAPAPKPTDREMLLRGWFDRNDLQKH